MHSSNEKWLSLQAKRLIQEGPYSSLYQLENEGEFFALKLFKEKVPEDLLKEAKVLSELQHKNWVRLIEDHSEESSPYFVTEWIEGLSLEKVESQNDFKLVLDIFSQVISALDYLHQKTWVHGDLKGSNILWTGTQVKIIDLGFAKNTLQMGSLEISGTPAYLAPELFFHRKAKTSSDFYAVAILFYRWLVGTFPFAPDNFQEMVRWHLFESPNNIHASLNYIPIEFGDLLLRMLAKNPGERPGAREILLFLNEKFDAKIPVVPEVKVVSQGREESFEVLGEAIRFYEGQKELLDEEKIVLAELYYRQGYLEKALAILEGKYSVEASLSRIKIFTRQGDFNRAQNELNDFEINFLKTLPDKFKLSFLNAKGVLQFYLGNLEIASHLFKDAEKNASSLQDFSQLAVAFNNLGNVLLEKDQTERSFDLFQKALLYAQKSGDRIHEGMFLMSMGYYYHRQKNISKAYDYYVKSIEVLRAVGQKNEMARSLLNFSNLLIEAGDLLQASRCLKEAQEIFHIKKLKYLSAYSLLIEGDIFSREAEYQKAIQVFQSAEKQLFEMKRSGDALWAMLHQAECKISLKAEDEAKKILEKIKKYPEFEKDTVLQGELKNIEKDFSMETNSYQGTYALFSFQKEIEKLEKELLGELDLSVLVEKILDKMIALTHAERGFVILRENEGLRIAIARNMEQSSLVDSPQQISFSIANEVMEKGEAVLTLDALEDERFSVVSSIHHLKLRSILCLPFKNEEKVLGAVYLDHRGQSGVFQPSLLSNLKPFAEMLGKILSNARRFFEVEKSLKETQKKLDAAEVELRLKYDYQNIVGQHSRMKEVFSMLDRVTDVEVPVVILGESGVGKELVAKAIHYNGSRSRRAFVSMNCQAIPENLFESELFGHVRGAFTGAVSDRMGLVEQSHRGTLFLDEIGDMPLALQGKLLRVLQEGKFRRLGDKEEKPVDLRVIAATHRDLKKMIAEGSFREDLWFRISVVEIKIPPLRERMEDLPLLVEYFLDRFSKQHGNSKKQLSSESLSLLSHYDWPGNIRELENTITNACVFSAHEKIEPNDFRYKQELFLKERESQSKKSEEMSVEEFLKFPYREAIQFFERKFIHQALIKSKGNITQASIALKVARPQLSRLIKKFKIKV